MIKKCKYLNNHQTACSLMIDDLVPVYVSYFDSLKPWNDWGFGKKNANSLFEYLDRNLFQKFPEIKGTFFIPLESHNNLPGNTGMMIGKSDFDESYIPFFKEYDKIFDVGFHGVKHTWYKDNNFLDTLNFEFSTLKLSDAVSLKAKILDFEKLYDLKITGGKFPGYHRKNEESFDLVREIGMKWWAFSLADNKAGKNEISVIKVKNGSITDIPSNINGNALNSYPNAKADSIKSKLRNLKQYWKDYSLRNYLDYLYANRLPITIQEHAQNQTFNGKRQRPNLFDDLSSLDAIFSIIRNGDIWYATCSELAHYHDSYLNTDIVNNENGDVKIQYRGQWDSMCLSFESDFPHLHDISTGNIVRGIAQSGKFIFNNLKSGVYRKWA